MLKDERYDISQYDDVLEIWGYEKPTDEQMQLIEKLLSSIPGILDALKKAYEEIDRHQPLHGLDVWDEDPDYGRGWWRDEVKDGNTNLGYWGWVSHRYEETASE
jgi:hypothetical protein